MEQYGNKSTYNLESVLVQNIKNSLYYVKKALDLENVYEVIDEIYEKVDNVEPWLSGNARGPSTAFCLLFRLAELNPSPPEIREMIDHKDSAYIRAIGLLYLRYCCNPRDLWKWFQKYMRDSESFDPSPANLGKPVTIGTFARDILLDQYYFETLFPRIPKTVSDEIKDHLQTMGLPLSALGNAGQGGADRRGHDDGARRPASVKSSLSVAFGQRAPNRAGAREQERGMGLDVRQDNGRGNRRDKERERDSRDRQSPANEQGNRGRDVGGSWKRGRSRSRDRDRYQGHRDHRSYRERSAERGRYGGGRVRNRSRDRGGDYRADQDPWRRDNEPSRDGGRYEDRNRDIRHAEGRRGRSRSRSRSRGRAREERKISRSRSHSGGRDASDVFKERPAAPSAGYGNLHNMY